MLYAVPSHCLFSSFYVLLLHLDHPVLGQLSLYIHQVFVLQNIFQSFHPNAVNYSVRELKVAVTCPKVLNEYTYIVTDGIYLACLRQHGQI